MIRLEGIDLILLFVLALIAVFVALAIGVVIGHRLGVAVERHAALRRVIRATVRIEGLNDEEFPDGYEFKEVH